MTLDDCRAPTAHTRRRIGGHAVVVGAVALVLAAALTSCRATPGTALTQSPAPTASVSHASSPSPTATPLTPTPTGTTSAHPEPTASDGVSVTVITLDVVDGAVQASGIVPGLVESGGECTLSLSLDGITRTSSVGATPGRESTYCGLVSVSTAGLAPGMWHAVLSYRSSTTEASSAPSQVQVS